MAQAAARRPFADRIGWNAHIKPWLVRAAIAAVFLLIGAYLVAPLLQARRPNHLPASFLALPAGVVSVTTLDGSSALLPVRIAGTSSARGDGLRGVGEDALDGEFVLYALSRETSGRASYATEGVRAPLDFAAVTAAGEITAVHPATTSGERVVISDPHRWLLVAKAGALERLGIGAGATLDPESVREF